MPTTRSISTTTRSRSGPRAGSAARCDIIAMLKDEQ